MPVPREGWPAAEAHYQRSRLFAELGRDEERREALMLARALDPGHTEATQATVAMLTAAGDHAAVASLDEEEAARPGQPDPGWYHLAAACAYRRANQADAASLALQSAVEAGYDFVEHERQAAVGAPPPFAVQPFHSGAVELTHRTSRIRKPARLLSRSTS